MKLDSLSQFTSLALRRLPFLHLFFLGSTLFLSGCSTWNVEPKELTPIQVFTYDITSTTSNSIKKWTITFALGGNPSQDPKKTLTDVGVCYSTTNMTPSTDDNYTTARNAVLPTSVTIATTEKATHYFRAYIIQNDGTTLYSRVGSFVPQ